VDQRLTNYFERRLDELQTISPRDEAGQPKAIVRDAVRQVRLLLARETGTTLRADGAIALTLGFTELVARPLLETDSISDTELRALVIDDMRRVALQAAATTGEQDVSSHAVVSALDQTWPDLQLANMPYW
jgi:hypothetical protein